MKLSPHFDRDEFSCSCGCGFNTVDITLLQVLEHVRLHFNKPVIIHSGCRCKEQNRVSGGSKKSQHLLARAADFSVTGVHSHEVYEWLDESYPHRFGLGKYNGWTHLDTRIEKARWEG